MCALYYNSKQKNYKDDVLRSYCDPKNKENCRRRQLLVALGDHSRVEVDQAVCCDRCTNGNVPYVCLRKLVQKGKKASQPKPKPLQEFTDDVLEELKKKLIEEREKQISRSIGLQALGSHEVCNSRTIAEVCKRAPYVESPKDLSSISGLRPQFYEPMYNIINSFVECIPPSPKR